MDGIGAVVLAGGRGMRMGRDKTAIVLGGRTLVQRAVDAASSVAQTTVVVVGSVALTPPIEAQSSVTFVADEQPGAGPLAGLVSGLTHIHEPIALVLACDQPFVQPVLLQLLVDRLLGDPEAKSIVPVVDGRIQPLCSALRREALPALRAALGQGMRGASVIADLEGARLLEWSEWSTVDPEGLSFIGVNTPGELERAASLVTRLG